MIKFLPFQFGPDLLFGVSVAVIIMFFVLWTSARINNLRTAQAQPTPPGISAVLLTQHLLENPGACLTPAGSYLRRFSLDELPQLWSIITGDMTFVGPRPALYNQEDLIRLRTAKRVHALTPGITGWAQVNGRDTIPIPLKVEFDEYYLRNKSFLLDMKILWMTISKVFRAEDVRH